jgi:hypothetical protein
MRESFVKYVPLVVCLICAALPLAAQDSSAPKTTRNNSKEDRQPGFTPQREAAALSFVRQHHPELGDLLTQLKAGNQREYQRVINELFNTSERLAQSQERDPLRYELELQAWKIDSRIRLLAARMAMNESDLLEAELKELLVERLDVQLEQQLLERQRVTTRLEKLDASIERIRKQRENEAQKSLTKLLEGIQKSRPARKPAARAGGNQSGSKAK